MSNFFLSTAYIYPVCPLSFNHARMFVITDVYSRYEKLKGNSVYFPIATHFSGNTAQHIAAHFSELFAMPDQLDKSDATYRLFTHFYKLPPDTILSFTDPLQILHYYNKETIQELTSLKINADYKHQYTTEDRDFSAFVEAIILKYQEKGLLVKNTKGDLSLQYENEVWRESARILIDATEYVHPRQKNTVLSAVNNIRSDWSLLRDNGYGAMFNNQIVDPMFDSELFMIFDLYIRFRDRFPDESHHPKDFFHGLFERLSSGGEPANDLEAMIIEWLPCRHFIAEEHLRNWLAKKAHAESVLLAKMYQTPKYTILGMGLLDGRRMSASKGTAILSKDLIETHGGLNARLIMLLQGGHLSKDFTYDAQLTDRVGKMVRKFTRHAAKVKSVLTETPGKKPEKIIELEDKIITNIESGYLRNALILLLDTCPKIFSYPSPTEAYFLTELYENYIERVFAPGALSRHEA